MRILGEVGRLAGARGFLFQEDIEKLREFNTRGL
jgi:hypothetical protein